jgi:peptide/nickel transport system ATP-binding protein
MNEGNQVTSTTDTPLLSLQDLTIALPKGAPML